MTHVGLQVYQTLLAEHGSNADHALQDLAERHAQALLKLDETDKKRSWAYSRELAPPTTGVLDDVPNAVDDGWVTTGREA